MSSGFAEVLDQYAEEAAILWLRRDRAVWQLHYGLPQLAKLDEQLTAQLAGLELSGEEGWQAAVNELRWGESAEIFAPSVFAFQQQDVAKIDFVIEQVEQCQQRIRPVVSALGWCRPDCILETLNDWSLSKEPLLRRLALAGFSAHRHDPGGCLKKFLNDPQPEVCCQAAFAIGELGRVDLLSALSECLVDENTFLRQAAAWSASRWQQAPTDAHLERLSNNDASWAEQIPLASLDMDSTELWLERWLAEEATRRSAIYLIGITGYVKLLPRLLAAMDQPQNARLAYAIWTLVTGIADPSLQSNPPSEADFGPSDDPADDNVTPDPDAHLPWPNVAAIAEIWQSQYGKWPQGSPLLYGQPRSKIWLAEVLQHATQPARALAAWELAQQNPKQPLWEIRAPGPQQLAKLGRAVAWSMPEVRRNRTELALQWEDESLK